MSYFLIHSFFRNLLLSCTVAVIIANFGIAGDGTVVTWLPSSKMAPLLTADPRAHQSSFVKNINSGEFIGSFGGILPVVKLTQEQHQYQLSIATAIYNTFYLPSDFLHVVTADFFVDVWLDTPVYNQMFLRLGVGHSSQHMVDDGLQIYKYSSINYSHDYLQAGIIHELFTPTSTVYAFVIYNHAYRISSKWRPGFSFQCGTEYCFASISSGITPYIAGDVKLRGELDYKLSQNYQAGVKFKGESVSQIRFALSYKAGAEERGQFYDKTVQLLGAGIYIDF